MNILVDIGTGAVSRISYTTTECKEENTQQPRGVDRHARGEDILNVNTPSVPANRSNRR